ncbi:MAG: hypothetical protein DRR42_13145 [Gammaproteobacteria bacterium]|nr:MAG: hypothetical protein DRR42_13145 [Gammaproteobacteria bacterium]
MKSSDLSFRPDTYWPESLTPEQLLTRIRGKRRQDIARQLYRDYGFGALNAFLVKEGLAENERSSWGAIGPWCMGGEYLPELEEGEIEIARISMASTTSDQISVRACQDGEHIRYRIVGEYEEDESMRQQLPFDVTDRPLSLGDLMDIIEGARTSDSAHPGGIFSSSWAMMLEVTNAPDEIVGFLSVSSAFYPEIDPCYRALAEQWLQEYIDPEE